VRIADRRESLVARGKQRSACERAVRENNDNDAPSRFPAVADRRYL
jgi:hypothetical protein